MIIKFTDKDTNVNYILSAVNGTVSVKREIRLRQRTSDGGFFFSADDDSNIEITAVREVLYGSNEGSSFIEVQMGEHIFAYEKTDAHSLIRDVINYVSDNKLPDKIQFIDEQEFNFCCKSVPSLYVSVDELGNEMYISTELNDVKEHNKGSIYAVTPEMIDFIQLEV